MDTPTTTATTTPAPANGAATAPVHSKAELASMLTGTKPFQPPTPAAAPTPPTTTTEAKPATTEAQKPGGIFSAFAPKTEPAPEAKPVPADWTEAIEVKGATAEHWKKLKGERDELRRTRDELTGRFTSTEQEAKKLKTEQEALQAKLAEFDRIAKEHKEYRERLSILDFQAMPEFRDKYEAPVKTARDEVEKALRLGKIEMSADALLALPETQRIDALGEIFGKITNPAVQAMLKDAMFAHLRYEHQRNDALKNADAVRKQFEQQQLLARQQTQERNRSLFEREFETSTRDLRPLEVAADAPEAERQAVNAYNEGLKRLRQRAEGFAFGEMNDQQVSKVAIGAAAAEFLLTTAIPGMAREHQAAQAKIAELQAKLDAIERARPGLSEHVANGQTGGSRLTNAQLAQMMVGARSMPG